MKEQNGRVYEKLRCSTQDHTSSLDSCAAGLQTEQGTEVSSLAQFNSGDEE